MDSPVHPRRPARWFHLILPLCGMLYAGKEVRAQMHTTGYGQSSAKAAGRNAGAAAAYETDRDGSNPKPRPRQAQAPHPGQVQQTRHEPQPGLPRIVASDDPAAETTPPQRAIQGQGLDNLPPPIGTMVPWPMPPALIIRHTPQVHGEVNRLLDQLRR